MDAHGGEAAGVGDQRPGQQHAARRRLLGSDRSLLGAFEQCAPQRRACATAEAEIAEQQVQPLGLAVIAIKTIEGGAVHQHHRPIDEIGAGVAHQNSFVEGDADGCGVVGDRGLTTGRNRFPEGLLIGPLGVEIHLHQALVGLGIAQIAINRAFAGDEIRLVGGERRGIVQGRQALVYIQWCGADVTHHLIGAAHYIVQVGVAEQLGIGVAELVVISRRHHDAFNWTTAANAARGDDREVVGGDGGSQGAGTEAGRRCWSPSGLGLEWEEFLIHRLIKGVVIEVVAYYPLLYVGVLLLGWSLIGVGRVIHPCSGGDLNLIDLRLVGFDLCRVHSPASLVGWQRQLDLLIVAELEG